MNKKISTYTGIITGIIILAFILILGSFHLPERSPVILLQYFILFLGILTSCILLYKNYADIKFVDSFTHCIRTAVTVIAIVLIGTTLLFIFFAEKKTFTAYTWSLMYTIFTYSLSGLLSSLFTSLIFNTFTKK